MNPEGHVADELHEHTAQAEGYEGPERRVLGHPDDDLVPAGNELLDQGTGGVVDRGGHLFVRCRCVLRGDVELDPSDVTLVQRRRRHDLENDRGGDLGGRDSRLLRRGYLA